jgi:hypothetical protein
VPRSVPLALVPALAAALAGCNDYGGKPKELLNQTTACKAVSDRLKVKGIEDRFGPAGKKEDFFGDTILTYRVEDTEWKFQVSENVGTFRALRQPKDRIEEILPCRT